MRSYTVVGVGAIGGYYGARLQQSGLPVRYLSPRGARHLREHGLRVESPEGDAVLAVEAAERAADLPASDTVMVAVKTTDTEAVLPLLPQLVKEGGSVLVMQNGLGVERPFATAVPGVTVLGAMCFICSTKVGVGHIRHLDYGSLTIGQHSGHYRPAGVTAEVEAVVGDLRAAGISASPVADLVTGRWQKLVWNIPFNGLSVVLDVDTSEVMADPSARDLAEQIMYEVVGAAAACGHGFESSFVDRMLRTTEKMRPYRPSMKVDFDAGRPLEVDRIYTDPITAAAAAGFPMPRTEVLLGELRRAVAKRDGRPIRPPLFTTR